MAGATVAEKKGGKKPKEAYTNSRLYEADASVLADLAAHRHTTVAEVYRALFAGEARTQLIKATQDRLNELKNG